jgi:hypothetical protein
MAGAIEVPIYAHSYHGEKPPKPNIPETQVVAGWGSSGGDAETLRRFGRSLSRADEKGVKLITFVAQKLSRKKKRRSGA